MGIEENKQLVRDWGEALAAGDGDRGCGMYAEKLAYYVVGDWPLGGHFDRQYMENNCGDIFTVFPKGLDFKAERIVAEGDWVCLEMRSEGEHLRGRLTYRNDGKWESADRVLRNGHGSCSEYNFAFIALARLNGLPARYVGASALRSAGPQYEDTVHHRWTEVYLPGHGWFPIDSSRNDGEDGSPVNRWFGRTSASLLVLMRGEGGKNHPLRWGYVATVDARRIGDGRLSKRKRFLWAKVPPTKAAASDGND